MNYYIKVPTANYFVCIIAESEESARRIFVKAMYHSRQRLPNDTIVKSFIDAGDMVVDLPLTAY